MSTGPPPRAVQDLPVGDTVKAAFRSVLGRLADLIRAAFVPLLISFVLYGLQLAVRDSPALSVLAELLLLLPYTLFAVAWHRLVLLGPAEAPAPMAPVWQKRHWRFLGYTLIVTAISYGFSLLYGPLIAPLLSEGSAIRVGEALLLMFMLLLATYLVLRLSFVFPAVAVDERYGFADSWRHTKDQGLPLLAAMFLTLIPAMLGMLMILQFLLVFVAADSSAAEPGALARAIDLVLRYVIIALSLSVLSIAFKVCTGWIPDLPGPPIGPLPGGPAEDGQDT